MPNTLYNFPTPSHGPVLFFSTAAQSSPAQPVFESRNTLLLNELWMLPKSFLRPGLAQFF
jgi:hypothetical protein